MLEAVVFWCLKHVYSTIRNFNRELMFKQAFWEGTITFLNTYALIKSFFQTSLHLVSWTDQQFSLHLFLEYSKIFCSAKNRQEFGTLVYDLG